LNLLVGAARFELATPCIPRVPNTPKRNPVSARPCCAAFLFDAAIQTSTMQAQACAARRRSAYSVRF